ncbi:hypothetical protein PR002_g12779 [Phytophthora rubi]|uniref:Uncharacterized protein n=1 Tax=Phytophthora rubi TaxID=129364 RepID=A0A6A3LND8_9STRA|nr:hypothetical protein PR002_g12779 [Phytophthora rubi]
MESRDAQDAGAVRRSGAFSGRQVPLEMGTLRVGGSGRPVAFSTVSRRSVASSLEAPVASTVLSPRLALEPHPRSPFRRREELSKTVVRSWDYSSSSRFKVKKIMGPHPVSARSPQIRTEERRRRVNDVATRSDETKASVLVSGEDVYSERLERTVENAQQREQGGQEVMRTGRRELSLQVGENSSREVSHQEPGMDREGEGDQVEEGDQMHEDISKPPAKRHAVKRRPPTTTPLVSKREKRVDIALPSENDAAIRAKEERRAIAREYMQLQKSSRRIWSAKLKEQSQREQEKRQQQLEVLEATRLKQLRLSRKRSNGHKKQEPVDSVLPDDDAMLTVAMSISPQGSSVLRSATGTPSKRETKLKVSRSGEEIFFNEPHLDDENDRAVGNLKNSERPTNYDTSLVSGAEEGESVLVAREEKHGAQTVERVRKLLELRGKTAALSARLSGLRKQPGTSAEVLATQEESKLESLDLRTNDMVRSRMDDIYDSENLTNNPADDTMDQLDSRCGSDNDIHEDAEHDNGNDEEVEDRESDSLYVGKEIRDTVGSGDGIEEVDDRQSDSSDIDRELQDTMGGGDDISEGEEDESSLDGSLGDEIIENAASHVASSRQIVQQTHAFDVISDTFEEDMEIDVRSIGVYSIGVVWPLHDEATEATSEANISSASSKACSSSSSSPTTEAPTVSPRAMHREIFAGQLEDSHDEPNGDSEEAFEVTFYEQLKSRLQRSTNDNAESKTTPNRSYRMDREEGIWSAFDSATELAYSSAPALQSGLSPVTETLTAPDNPSSRPNSRLMRLIRETDDSLSVVDRAARILYREQIERSEREKEKELQIRIEAEKKKLLEKDLALKAVMDAVTGKNARDDDSGASDSDNGGGLQSENDDAEVQVAQYKRLEEIMDEVEKERARENGENNSSSQDREITRDGDVTTVQRSQQNLQKRGGITVSTSSPTFWDQLVSESALHEFNVDHLDAGRPHVTVDDSELVAQREAHLREEDEQMAGSPPRVHSPRALSKKLMAAVDYQEAIFEAHMQLAVMEHAHELETVQAETITLAQAFKEEMEHNATAHQLALDHATLEKKFDDDMHDVMQKLTTIREAEEQERMAHESQMERQLRQANLRECSVQTESSQRADAATSAALYVDTSSSPVRFFSDVAVQHDAQEVVAGASASMNDAYLEPEYASDGDPYEEPFEKESKMLEPQPRVSESPSIAESFELSPLQMPNASSESEIHSVLSEPDMLVDDNSLAKPKVAKRIICEDDSVADSTRPSASADDEEYEVGFNHASEGDDIVSASIDYDQDFEASSPKPHSVCESDIIVEDDVADNAAESENSEKSEKGGSELIDYEEDFEVSSPQAESVRENDIVVEDGVADDAAVSEISEKREKGGSELIDYEEDFEASSPEPSSVRESDHVVEDDSEDDAAVSENTEESEKSESEFIDYEEDFEVSSPQTETACESDIVVEDDVKGDAAAPEESEKGGSELIDYEEEFEISSSQAKNVRESDIIIEDNVSDDAAAPEESENGGSELIDYEEDFEVSSPQAQAVRESDSIVEDDVAVCAISEESEKGGSELIDYEEDFEVSSPQATAVRENDIIVEGDVEDDAAVCAISEESEKGGSELSDYGEDFEVSSPQAKAVRGSDIIVEDEAADDAAESDNAAESENSEKSEKGGSELSNYEEDFEVSSPQAESVRESDIVVEDDVADDAAASEISEQSEKGGSKLIDYEEDFEATSPEPSSVRESDHVAEDDFEDDAAASDNIEESEKGESELIDYEDDFEASSPKTTVMRCDSTHEHPGYDDGDAYSDEGFDSASSSFTSEAPQLFTESIVPTTVHSASPTASRTNLIEEEVNQAIGAVVEQLRDGGPANELSPVQQNASIQFATEVSKPLVSSVSISISHDGEEETLTKSIEERITRLQALRQKIADRKNEIVTVQKQIRVEKRKEQLAAEENLLLDEMESVEKLLRVDEAALALCRQRNQLEMMNLEARASRIDTRQTDLLFAFDYVEEACVDEVQKISLDDALLERSRTVRGFDLLDGYIYIEDAEPFDCHTDEHMLSAALLPSVTENNGEGEGDEDSMKEQVLSDLLDGYTYVEDAEPIDHHADEPMPSTPDSKKKYVCGATDHTVANEQAAGNSQNHDWDNKKLHTDEEAVRPQIIPVPDDIIRHTSDSEHTGSRKSIGRDGGDEEPFMEGTQAEKNEPSNVCKTEVADLTSHLTSQGESNSIAVVQGSSVQQHVYGKLEIREDSTDLLAGYAFVEVAEVVSISHAEPSNVDLLVDFDYVEAAETVDVSPIDATDDVEAHSSVINSNELAGACEELDESISVSTKLEDSGGHTDEKAVVVQEIPPTFTEADHFMDTPSIVVVPQVDPTTNPEEAAAENEEASNTSSRAEKWMEELSAESDELTPTDATDVGIGDQALPPAEVGHPIDARVEAIADRVSTFIFADLLQSIEHEMLYSSNNPVLDQPSDTNSMKDAGLVASSCHASELSHLQDDEIADESSLSEPPDQHSLTGSLRDEITENSANDSNSSGHIAHEQDAEPSAGVLSNVPDATVGAGSGLDRAAESERMTDEIFTSLFDDIVGTELRIWSRRQLPVPTRSSSQSTVTSISSSATVKSGKALKSVKRVVNQDSRARDLNLTQQFVERLEIVNGELRLPALQSLEIGKASASPAALALYNTVEVLAHDCFNAIQQTAAGEMPLDQTSMLEIIQRHVKTEVSELLAIRELSERELERQLQLLSGEIDAEDGLNGDVLLSQNCIASNVNSMVSKVQSELSRTTEELSTAVQPSRTGTSPRTPVRSRNTSFLSSLQAQQDQELQQRLTGMILSDLLHDAGQP